MMTSDNLSQNDIATFYPYVACMVNLNYDEAFLLSRPGMNGMVGTTEDVMSVYDANCLMPGGTHESQENFCLALFHSLAKSASIVLVLNPTSRLKSHILNSIQKHALRQF
jgi:hypothetical protein